MILEIRLPIRANPNTVVGKLRLVDIFYVALPAE